MSWACTIGIWSTLAQLNLNLVSARLSSRHAISKLDDSPQNRNISCNTKRFNVQLERLMFCKDVCKLYHSTLHWAIWRNATPFVCTLYNSKLRWAIWRNATPFMRTCATRHYPEPFDATLHRLWTILQMSAKLFVIELVHFTISCSNSTWATGPFIIWLDYSCLGCSVSWRKTKPSIIWSCHSFNLLAILSCSWSLNQLCICWSIWHPCIFGGDGRSYRNSVHVTYIFYYRNMQWRHRKVIGDILKGTKKNSIHVL